MTEQIIQKAIYQHFINYEYKLFNTYVFNWECDFFCISSSGYINEIEVKISRSDFFADFKKEKHRIFIDKSMGKTYSCLSHGHCRGDLLCRVPEVEIGISGRYHDAGLSDLLNGSKPLIERKYRTGGYEVNNWGMRLQVHTGRRNKEYHAPATRIRFEKLDQYKTPHRFWYAVPAGLIVSHEVPRYAGLIYVSDKVVEVKKAPYMHKLRQDITKELLKKYYNLWEYKLGREQKMEINNLCK